MNEVFVNGMGWVESDPRPEGHDMTGVVIGRALTIKDIVSATVRVTGVPEATLMDRSVDPVTVRARWAMWLAACETSRHSRNWVARKMGRDHSTVYLGIKKAERDLVERIKVEARAAL